jgi:dipeptidyl aminopeptidase/acylaminoacyl peptidase
VHAFDDEVCNVSESTLYADELFKHNVPVEMHLYNRGGHGFGLGRKEDGTDQWLNLLISWLNSGVF